MPWACQRLAALERFVNEVQVYPHVHPHFSPSGSRRTCDAACGAQHPDYPNLRTNRGVNARIAAWSPLCPRKNPCTCVYCPRCDLALWRMRRVSFHFPLACGLAALFFYMSALSAPFLEISAYGRFQLARIATGPAQLTSQGYNSVACWSSPSP